MGGQVNNSVQVTNDGFFMVDGEKLDLGQLMMNLQLDMTIEIDRQIADQMAEIKERNEKLSLYNDILAAMRKAKSEGEKYESHVKVTLPDGSEKSVYALREDMGYSDGWTLVGGSKNKGSTATIEKQWDANIELVKGKIDSLNSESQLDMIRLQSLMDKRNQRYEQASNTLQKDQKTRDTITGNTR
jgi:hypothetical protein